MGYEWFKLYSKGWLTGSIRAQLTIEERSVWADLLAFANECRERGFIARAPGIPYTRQYLANLFEVPLETLNCTIEKCQRDVNAEGSGSRLTVNPDGTMIIGNWERYQASSTKKVQPYPASTELPGDKPQQHTLPVDGNLASAAKLYEDNIGIITPITADKLKEITERYSVGWFEAAVAEAVENNVRKLVYIESILERWKVEGFKSAKKGAKDGKLPKPGRDYSQRRLPTDEEREASIGKPLR